MNLERIEVTPFPMIISEIVLEKRTGHLTVIAESVRKVLFWSQGEVVLVSSSLPEDSLAAFATRREAISPEQARGVSPADPLDAVPAFRGAPGLDNSTRQSILRDWMTAVALPLFSLDEGTSVFVDDTAIPPEKRVFLQSTPGFILQGIRSISNGLVLRRSLGNMKREIVLARDAHEVLDRLPFNDPERRLALSLEQPATIETFLKRFASDSVSAALSLIALLTFGVFVTAEAEARPETRESTEDLERDLALLASIGSQDKRSLRAAGLAKQLGTLDYYGIIDAPRASSRNQILQRVEEAKKKYAPETYPPAVRESATAIYRKVEEAGQTLGDTSRRHEYDLALGALGSGKGAGRNVQQRLTQRSIAEKNLAKARDLAFSGDYYGAIVLLKQSAEYAPDLSEAWFLLGSCQERNPHWRREASESYMKVLALNPNHVLAMTALGDLYRTEGLASRAQSYYEDALQIEPENAQLKKRIRELKK